MYMPALRPEISITVHAENSEQYLLLSDPFEIAEGGIMVHAEMLDILEACTGEVTFEEFAAAHKTELDGKEMMQVRAFLSELSLLGFMYDEYGAQLYAQRVQEWNARTTRKAVCVGGTYDTNPDAVREQLAAMMRLAKPHAIRSKTTTRAMLMPHIDYRVSENAYGACMHELQQSTADVFVIIGTSHYWHTDSVVLTNKHFETPLGLVQTHQEVVEMLTNELGHHVCEHDLAHKPEHSVELHTLILQYLHGQREFSIVPILVAGSEPNHFEEIGSTLQRVLVQSGVNYTVLISGDLSHVGIRFGDDVAAEHILGEVEVSDRVLLAHLEQGDRAGYGAYIEQGDNEFRVCGYAPTLVGLATVGPCIGETLAYEVWNDTPTNSAVTYAGMRFYTE